MAMPPQAMRPVVRFSAAVLAAVLTLGASMTAAQEPTRVVLGTATPGGGFPVYGAAYASTINAVEPTLRVETRNTKGSTENVPLVAAGELDLGQATGEVTYEAIMGIGRPRADVRIINAMYSQSGMFIVRADSPVRTIADLKGKRIAWGARGSGFVVLARYVMDGLGLDFERDFEGVLLDRAGDGPAMVLDGRVAALWGGGSGWPGFTAITSSPAGGRFVAPTDDEIARIVARHTFLKPLTLAAGSYPGQTQPVRSVGAWSFVLARPTLPDDVAYRLARAVHRGEAMIGEKLAQARETSLRATVDAAPRTDLIHPGVLAYMREIGLVR
jgi:TRAP transporter TAXI family solute receptor